MKKIIIVIFFSFCNMIIAQNDIIETDSLLLWQSERKLTWNDFKGKPKENPINEVANIKGSIAIVDTYWLDDIPKFEVRCYIKKYESWNIVTDSLSLKHEQGHFDIYEIYTRKIRKAFDSLNQKKVKNIGDYEYIHRKNIEDCNQLNNLYEETNFDSEIQQEWTDRITKELQALKEYEYKPKK